MDGCRSVLLSMRAIPAQGCQSGCGLLTGRKASPTVPIGRQLFPHAGLKIRHNEPVALDREGSITRYQKIIANIRYQSWNLFSSCFDLPRIFRPTAVLSDTGFPVTQFKYKLYIFIELIGAYRF